MNINIVYVHKLCLCAHKLCLCYINIVYVIFVQTAFHTCRGLTDPASILKSPSSPYGGSPTASLKDLNRIENADDQHNSFGFPTNRFTQIPASRSHNPEEHRWP